VPTSLTVLALRMAFALPFFVALVVFSSYPRRQSQVCGLSARAVRSMDGGRSYPEDFQFNGERATTLLIAQAQDEGAVSANEF
jgi:hypothetical protein